MFNLGTALVLATAVSAIPSSKIAKRDVDTVLTNLQTIDAQTNTLTTTINSWDGSLLGALGISGEVTTLEVCTLPFPVPPRHTGGGDDDTEPSTSFSCD